MANLSELDSLRNELAAIRHRAARLERIADRRRHTAQLQSALYQIADITAADGPTDQFFQALHDIMARLMYAENFFIALYDPDASTFSLTYMVDSLDQSYLADMQNVPISQLHGTLTGYVLRTGKPLFADETVMDALQVAGEIGQVGSNCIEWLGCPLKVGQRTLGAMVIQSYDRNRRYRQSDRKLLLYISRHVATAVDRKQADERVAGINRALEAKVEERTHQLKTINDELEQRIAERTQALANTNSVLEHLLEQRKATNEKLAHDAHHDGLTGLPNRALLRERLGHTIQRNMRQKKLVYALLFLDLDRFKIINDSLGHLSGDKLLCEVASRLQQSVRPGDTVARLGGDEFCILLDNVNSVADIKLISNRILATIAEVYLLDEQRIYTSTSIGITTNQVGYKAAEAAIRDADAAMYQAKAQGKNRYCIFDKSLHRDALNRLKLEVDLRHAIDRHEILVYYQPIYDLHQQSLHGFEALARWQHPELGMLSPALFIPVAEETGLINELGLQVLRDATLQIHDWRQQTGTELSVSVNLSGRQLAQRDFLSHVSEILQDSQLPPQALKLEITESLLIQHFEMAQQFLQRLQDMHIEILLDDFGTGYSSLNYLHQFPLNTVKIDRSFVQQITSQKKSLQLLKGVQLLASNLGLKLVAEGIETQAQLQLLQGLSFEFGQGYLFGAPMPAEQASALLSGGRHLAFADSMPK